MGWIGWINDIIDSIKREWISFKNWVLDRLSNIGKIVDDAIRPIREWINSAIDGIKAWVSSEISKLQSAIQNIGSWINSYVVVPLMNAWKALEAKFYEMHNWIIGQLNSFYGEVGRKWKEYEQYVTRVYEKTREEEREYWLETLKSTVFSIAWLTDKLLTIIKH